MIGRTIVTSVSGLLAFLATVVAQPTAATAQTSAPAPAPFALTSPALHDGAVLDKHFAGPADCGGDNVSLPMNWANPPAKTKSFAIVLFDMDGGKNGGVTHWIAYGIPPDARSFAAGEGNVVSKQFVGGSNLRNLPTYIGPCAPSIGLPHHYIYTLYALDAAADELPPGLTRDDFMAKMKGHFVGASSLVSLYKRP